MKLAHSEAGEGPALILLHAGVADRRMWDEHLEPLAAASGRRVVAVDLPGFGDARVEREPVAHWLDVAETMDALGIGRAALVGSSFGAAVALRVAALDPERVSSLLLFSAPAVPESEPTLALHRAWEAEEAALKAGDFERAAQAVASAWVYATGDAHERVAAMALRNYEQHWRADGPEWEVDFLEEDPGLLGTIECPVLLAAGEWDLVDFRVAVAELAEVLPQATTAMIPYCGHLAPLEAPEEFRRLALGALA